MSSEVGYKADENKPRLDLVFGDFANALWEVGQVGTFGANKYTDSGWIEVDNAIERYSSAMLRHYLQYKSGQIDDPESGFSHLAHVAWNALAILELSKQQTKSVVSWKDHIADFYECNQELYNEPCAIHKEVDEKVRDAIVSYFAKYDKEREDK